MNRPIRLPTDAASIIHLALNPPSGSSRDHPDALARHLVAREIVGEIIAQHGTASDDQAVLDMLREEALAGNDEMRALYLLARPAALEQGYHAPELPT
jgi:hypothetical protein